MVRKRSRSSRKYYDDENDSDSDFALEEPAREPAQKKYSLRQRKRRIFTEFEFDDDGDEIEPTKVPSDDDDFQVEKELELEEAPGTEYIDKETYINHYEPENEEMPEDADGLIDFEDMIRADIVVNKNRIDYDNIIQKTEIKVQPIEETVQPVVKSKRGRKPKARPEGEIDSSLLEPETEMQEAEFEDKNDQDYNPDDDEIDNDEPIDCAKLMHAELSESASEMHSVQRSDPASQVKNELHSENNAENNIAVVKPQEDDTNANTEKEILPDSISNEQVSNKVINVGGENVISENKNIETNTTESSSECLNNHTMPEKLLPVPKEGEVDDDVVLVEDDKKCEVIVLDD